MIDEAQSAFILGMLIMDNALIALEVFHKLKSPTYKHQGFMALMLDMKKAYDRVEWSYIHSMMISLGFLSLFML